MAYFSVVDCRMIGRKCIFWLLLCRNVLCGVLGNGLGLSLCRSFGRRFSSYRLVVINGYDKSVSVIARYFVLYACRNRNARGLVSVI